MNGFCASCQTLLTRTDVSGSALTLTLQMDRPANHRNDDDSEQRNRRDAEFLM